MYSLGCDRNQVTSCLMQLFFMTRSRREGPRADDPLFYSVFDHNAEARKSYIAAKPMDESRVAHGLDGGECGL